MKLIVYTILLLATVSAVRGSAADEKVVPPVRDFELVLDEWPQAGFPQLADGKFHPKVAVRNLGFQKIAADQSLSVLMKGTLHLGRPDGTESSYPLGIWRGRAPSDIGRGELAAHVNNTAVETAFSPVKPGRYLLWWTSGEMRSNSVVLDKDDNGLHRRP